MATNGDVIVRLNRVAQIWLEEELVDVMGLGYQYVEKKSWRALCFQKQQFFS